MLLLFPLISNVFKSVSSFLFHPSSSTTVKYCTPTPTVLYQLVVISVPLNAIFLFGEHSSVHSHWLIPDSVFSEEEGSTNEVFGISPVWTDDRCERHAACGMRHVSTQKHRVFHHAAWCLLRIRASMKLK